MPYEIVLRGKVAYLRTKPDRTVTVASPFRLQNLIQFAHLAIGARDKKSGALPSAAEEIRLNMKPIGRVVKGKPVIEITGNDLTELQGQMIRRGITSVTFPENVILKKGTYGVEIRSQSKQIP